MDYKTLADSIIRNIGGCENIAGLTHCATRLRFTLREETKVEEEALHQLPGVLGIARNGGQFQIIVGNEVPKVYAAIHENYTITGELKHTAVKKQKRIEWLFDFVSSIFTPVLPAIIGAGLVKSVLALAVLLGMDDQGTTYLFLNVIGDAPLYFLPMMLAVTTSKKLGCNLYMAIAITGALLHPTYTALITDAFNLHFSSMFGIPVTLASYNSSVIPVVLMVVALKQVDRILDHVIPSLIKFFFKPLLTMLIVAILTFIVLGPIGFVSGVAISTGLNWLSEYAGWLVPTIIGAIFPLMVMTGMHYGTVPFMLQSISAQGFEQITGPGNLPSNIAQGAASLAVAIKTKKSELKQIGLTSGLTALLGITEPALFAVTLKYKKVLTSVMMGGACGGLYAGLMGTKCFSFCSPGLLSLVAYVGPDGWGNLMHSCISMGISFVVTFILVWFWGYHEEEVEPDTSLSVMPGIVNSPAKGTLVALSDVKDPTFSQELMGKGFAVIPEEGRIVSPVNGTIITVFPTGHAIGIMSDTGIELLIHIGLDTVNLNGKYFDVKVQEGTHIKCGELLVQFDIEGIIREGYDVTTMVVVTNTASFKEIIVENSGQVEESTQVLSIR